MGWPRQQNTFNFRMSRQSPSKQIRAEDSHMNTIPNGVAYQRANLGHTENLNKYVSYSQQEEHSHVVLPVAANPPVQQTQIIQDGNTIVINGPPPNTILIKAPPEQPKKDPVWTREERVGCCCISVDHQCFFCDILCMNALCRCVQHSNLCCYCANHDCMHCCIHSLCRTCCFQKGMLECFVECCKHMPLCLCLDCLKNAGCGECLCNCLQNCNICELVRNCDCNNTLNCVGEVICGIVCCLFK